MQGLHTHPHMHADAKAAHRAVPCSTARQSRPPPLRHSHEATNAASRLRWGLLSDALAIGCWCAFAIWTGAIRSDRVVMGRASRSSSHHRGSETDFIPAGQCTAAYSALPMVCDDLSESLTHRVRP